MAQSAVADNLVEQSPVSHMTEEGLAWLRTSCPRMPWHDVHCSVRGGEGHARVPGMMSTAR
jgi:hypothetical protein